MKTFRTVLLIALAVILAITLATAAIAGTFLFDLNQKTKALTDDFSALADKYPKPLAAGPGEPVTQEISCGYAVISQVAGWAGKDISEEDLAAAHETVVTSTAEGFANELARVLPKYEIAQKSWLSDSQLLDAVCGSLQAGYPVPIQWAAQLDGVWTLHYSLVTAADLPGDRITVLNPYGYTEVLTQAEFLSRTGFQAFRPMPLWMKLAFALDVFQKNTIFILSPA